MSHSVGALLSAVAGVGLILVALFDVFATLFGHAERYAVSRAVTRATWWACHRLVRPGLTLAGSTSYLLVVASWVAMLVIGWALVYWPWMPASFLHPPGFDTSGSSLLDSLYFSLVNLSTLGYGDISPAAGWLRLVAPLQALLGFAIVTATVSWLLSIFPVLARRRALAYEICLLAEVRGDPDDPGPPTPLPSGIYSDLTSRLIAVERDLVTFPVAYYFQQNDVRFALAAQMEPLLELAEDARRQPRRSDTHFHAGLLLRAIDDFAATLAERFYLPGGVCTKDVLAAYARDHAVQITRVPS